MGTDDRNDLEILRAKVRRLETEILERNAVILRVSEALRHPPVYASEANRLYDLMHHLLPRQ